MRFIKYLQEEYVMNVKGTWSERYSGISDVFENPSRKELKTLDDDVRFFINFKTRKLYVWNWNITHTEMAGHLYKERLIPSDIIGERFTKNCFAGIATKDGNKLKLTRRSDCLWTLQPAEWPADDNWLNTWFGENTIQQIKELCPE